METPNFSAAGDLAQRMPGSRYILPSFEEHSRLGLTAITMGKILLDGSLGMFGAEVNAIQVDALFA